MARKKARTTRKAAKRPKQRGKARKAASPKRKAVSAKSGSAAASKRRVYRPVMKVQNKPVPMPAVSEGVPAWLKAWVVIGTIIIILALVWLFVPF